MADFEQGTIEQRATEVPSEDGLSREAQAAAANRASLERAYDRAMAREKAAEKAVKGTIRDSLQRHPHRLIG